MDRTNDLDPETNADVQEALHDKWSVFMVCLLPLSSGRVAVFDRGFSLFDVIENDISVDDLRVLGKEVQTKLFIKYKLAQESRFLGEPDDRQYAKDLSNGRKVPTPRPRNNLKGRVVDITL